MPCAAKAVYPVVSGVVQKRPIPHRCNPQPTKKNKNKNGLPQTFFPPRFTAGRRIEAGNSFASANDNNQI